MKVRHSILPRAGTSKCLFAASRYSVGRVKAEFSEGTLSPSEPEQPQVHQGDGAEHHRDREDMNNLDGGEGPRGLLNENGPWYGLKPFQQHRHAHLPYIH